MVTSIEYIESKPELITKIGKPSEWLSTRAPEAFNALSIHEWETVQLYYLNKRFSDLKDKVPALKKLIGDEDVSGSFTHIHEVVPYLFTHQSYKSYPLSLLEKSQFMKLTKWMDKFTAIPLMETLDHDKLKKLKSIDDWLAYLEQHDMFVLHSSGTTGKLSFLPRTNIEKEYLRSAWYQLIQDTCKVDAYEHKMPFFFPAFNWGRQLANYLAGQYGPEFAPLGEYHPAIHDNMSADFMSLAGRIKKAQAKGELGKRQLIGALVKSRGGLLTMKKKMEGSKEAWLDKLFNEYKGKSVYIMATWPDLIKSALAAQERGETKIFGEGTVLFGGGGMKGYDAPENWRELLMETYNANRVNEGFGMTESLAWSPKCDAGYFHFYPSGIPFVLDEEGKPLPREGVQTGRLAIFDLLAETYWGGFVTGDKVTIHFDDKCECGWHGPIMDPEVKRFSELEGGDDKISCAGVNNQWTEFLEFIEKQVD